MSVGRYLADASESETWFEAPGATVLMAYTPDPADDDVWIEVHFACKTCRDQGKPFRSTSRVAELTAEVNRLWDDAVSSGAATRRGRMVAHVDP